MDDRKEAQEEREITSTLEWFQFIQDFADKLTLKRIVTVFVTGFLATLVVMLYENRDVVFQKAYNLMSTPAAPPTSWVTSQKSKDDLTALVDKSKLI
jgi:ABC-type multidrug transport system permease subunit